MKKQRIRSQDYPVLYDPLPLTQVNALTRTNFYSRYTWRQELHILNVPDVPQEVEQVFARNEENKKVTDKLKLMKAILADTLGFNNKEPHQPPTVESGSLRDTEEERKREDEYDDRLLSVSKWRKLIPKEKKKRLAARSKVPLHLMTSATMGNLPLEEPTLRKTEKRSMFMTYATDPRFHDLLTLVRRRNPRSALLGQPKVKQVTWGEASIGAQRPRSSTATRVNTGNGSRPMSSVL